MTASMNATPEPQVSPPTPPIVHAPTAVGGGSHPCGWCGKDAVEQIEIEPAKYGTKKGPITNPNTGITRVASYKVIVKAPIMSFVCPDHLAMVRRNEAEIEREAAVTKAHNAWVKRGKFNEGPPGQEQNA